MSDAAKAWVITKLINEVSGALIGVPVILTRGSVASGLLFYNSELGSWTDGYTGIDPNRIGDGSFAEKFYRRDANGNWVWNNGYLREDGSFDPYWDNVVEEEWLKDSLNDIEFRIEQRKGDANINGTPDIHESINPNTKSWWDTAKNWIQRRDPLTLDLDGDGLETTGIAATNPILFDHDGDGIKNGTGWVSSDDAFLVLDKNGNGSIDTGRELFGDNTLKSNGQLAKDGFDALADLDSVTNGGNGDGVVNAADSQYANLKLWRDLNQDGISQTGELFTLASQNIIGINTGITAHSQTLANGNQIADKGTFIKSNGTLGELGDVTGNLADINLAEDTFHRTFTNTLDTTSVQTLPDMQGSGKVRDLREAATQSTTLQNLLTQYSAATTRTAQIALLDQLLDAWADTGGMAEGLTQRVAANDEEWRVLA